MNEALFSSNRDDWETPRWLFEPFREEYSLTLDVAASDKNHLCERWYTKENSGLEHPWNGPTWCNPPYGRDVGKWVKQGWLAGKNFPVVMLLAARTDTRWFHDFIVEAAVEVCLIRGRLRFGINGEPQPDPAPFPSMVVVWLPRMRRIYRGGPRFTTLWSEARGES